MKIFVSILVATLFISTLFGQVEFSVELVFQDADGNTDTLIVGHDDRATFSIDADLGEENIGSPWDAVFEVRVTNAQTTRDVYDTIFTPSIQTKRQIINYQCSREYANSSKPIYIDVKAMKWPVSVSWDSSAFSAYCNLKSHMGFVSWADVGFQLADISSISSSQFYSDDRPYNTYLTTNGDTIASVFWIAFADLANTTNILENEEMDLKIYPIPATNLLHIEYSQSNIPTIKHYKIINLQGITTKEGTFHCDLPINIGEIPEGLYFLQMFHSKGAFFIQKFLKE